MDTSNQSQGQQVDVQARINAIKANMPQTYKGIQEKAQREGSHVYALVRRAVRGEPNCFYAVEGGWVAGTPFNMPDVHATLAQYMVTFGCAHLLMWAAPQEAQG